MNKDKIARLRKYYEVADKISDKQIEKDLGNSFCSAIYDIEIAKKRLNESIVSIIPVSVKKFFIKPDKNGT